MTDNWVYSLDEIERIAAQLDLRAPNAEGVNELARLLAQEAPSKGAPLECVANVATGVGKTWMMAGAMEYLYTTCGVRKFMVVVPTKTILGKTKAQFSAGHARQIKGLSFTPTLITSENFQSSDAREALNDPDVPVILLFVVNSLTAPSEEETRKAHGFSEDLGGSLYERVSGLQRLVVFADEYHSLSGPVFSSAIRGLGAVATVGLTATPLPQDKSKVFYEYGLAHALSDMFVKAPVIVGRADDLAQDDKAKIQDGLTLLRAKQSAIDSYVAATGAPYVKAVMLVVAPDIEAANEVKAWIDGPDMHRGWYGGEKSAIVTSRQSEQDRDAVLGTIDESSNPVCVVISVDMLREGWDSKSVFVLVSLRASVSEILTAQTLGRGLRLPWGEWVEAEMLNTLEVVAHEKYEQLLASADLLTSRLLSADDWQNGDTHELTLLDVANDGLATGREETLSSAPLESATPRDTQVAVRSGVGPALRPRTAGSQRQPSWRTKPRVGKPTSSPSPRGSTSMPSISVKRSAERVREQEEEARLLGDVLTSPMAPAGRFEIHLPSVIPSPTAHQSSLSQVVDMNAIREAASRVPRSGAEVLQRRIGTATVDAVTGEARVKFEKRADGDVRPEDSAGLFDLDTRDALFQALHTSALTSSRNLREETQAAWRIIDGFLESFTSDEDRAALARYREQAADILLSEVRRQISEANRHPMQWAHTIEWKPLPQRRPRLDTVSSLEGYDSHAKANRGYDGWNRSAYESNWFDSSPEFVLARLLDDAETNPSIEYWVRLQNGDIQIRWQSVGASNYNPDFLVVESATPQCIWIVEVKSDKEATSEEVLKKASAASSWASHLTEKDTQGRTWRYLLVTQGQVEQSLTWARLVAFGESNIASRLS